MLIHEKMLALANRIGHIELGHQNEHHGYQYRSVYDVMQKAAPVLADLGLRLEIAVDDVSVVPAAKGFLTTAKYTLTYVAEDGSKHSVQTLAQGYDSTDKGAYKGMAGGYKYCWMQGLCIPVGPPDDPEREEAPRTADSQPERDWAGEFKKCRSLAKLEALADEAQDFFANVEETHPSRAAAVMEYRRKKEMLAAG